MGWIGLFKVLYFGKKFAVNFYLVIDPFDMNHKSGPRISIIVAVYNGVSTLKQCIDSVSCQTYQSSELIIIDGGSQDGSVELIEANQEQISYWISEPDSGIYNAWNKGLEVATGDWLCFLGADDYFWNDHVLEKISIVLSEIPSEIYLAYARVMLLSADGEVLFPVGEPWGKVAKRFREGFCLPHQGVMHRRTIFERNGGFDESFRIGGDYELMLRELKTGNAAFIPDIILTAMRQGGLSSNPTTSLEALRDIRRAQRMLGQQYPSFFWVVTLMRVYIRLALWNLIGEKLTRRILDVGRRIKGLPPYWTKT